MGGKVSKIPIVGDVAKTVGKIIPKEIKPVLPYIAAMAGIPPMISGSSWLTTAANQALYAAAAKAAMDPNANIGDVLRTGAVAAAPGVISQGITALNPSLTNMLGKDSKILSGITKAQEFLKHKPDFDTKTASLLAAQTTVGELPQYQRMNEEALRDYEANLAKQGILDKAARRQSIFNYFSGATANGSRVYSDDEINSFLAKYGYRYGGSIRTKRGLVSGPGKYSGDRYVQLLEQFMYEGYDYDTASEMAFKALRSGDYLKEDYNKDKKAYGGRVGYKYGLSVLNDPMDPSNFPYAKFDDEDEEDSEPPEKFNTKDFMDSLSLASTGLNYLQPKQAAPFIPGRFAANGGIMGYARGNVVTPPGQEMDLRPGGFIPIGSKEKADDVNARVSKNEFVMTAKAVRGADPLRQNDPRRGAKKMYQIMNKYESIYEARA